MNTLDVEILVENESINAFDGANERSTSAKLFRRLLFSPISYFPM